MLLGNGGFRQHLSVRSCVCRSLLVLATWNLQFQRVRHYKSPPNSAFGLDNSDRLATECAALRPVGPLGTNGNEHRRLHWLTVYFVPTGGVLQVSSLRAPILVGYFITVGVHLTVSSLNGDNQWCCIRSGSATPPASQIGFRTLCHCAFSP